jgi:hypothetical protein
MKRTIVILLAFALSGCASDFEKLIAQVKENCHTTIDAQIQAGAIGIGGSGRFQQECWPIKKPEVLGNE